MDVSQFCRTCLKNHNAVEMLSIYDSIDGFFLPDHNNVPFSTTKQTVSEMIEVITGNKIISSTLLPTKICDNCTDKVKISFEFKNQCKKSFQALTKMLKDKFITTTSIEMDNSDFYKINTNILDDNIQINQSIYDSKERLETTEQNHKEIQTDEHLFYECEICDYKFFDEFSLKDHRTTHSDIRCRICQKTFACLKYLENHIFVFHNKVCKKTFGKNKTFIDHIELHAHCGKDLENIVNSKRINDVTITRRNKLHITEEQFDIKMVQLNAQSKWECKNCGNLYNNESKLFTHICKSEREIKSSTHTVTLPNEPSIILKNTQSMAIKSSTTDTRSSTRKRTTPLVISNATNPAIKKEILSDNDCYNLEQNGVTPFEIIFTNELNNICNMKIENKNNDDAYSKHDLNLNDEYENYHSQINKRQGINVDNNSNSNTDFDVCENTDDDNKDFDEMQLKKAMKLKNMKQNELVAEVQQPSIFREIVFPTEQNYNFSEITMSSIADKHTIESKSINKKSSTKIEIPCDLCKHSFDNFEAFTRHMECHATITKKIHKCSMCNAAFKRKSHLTRHYFSHSDERPFHCTICNKSFKSPFCLTKHKLTHDEKRLTCTICNIKYKLPSHLTSHKKKEHNTEFMKQITFICDICSAVFVSFENIKRHMGIHTGQRQYECKFCNERFKLYKEKRKHLRSHMKDSNCSYLCPECGKTLKGGSNYKVHMRRHNGENPYSCKFCDKAFPRSADLQAHERHHTNVRPHKCSVCGKAFTRSYDLVVHVRTHTGERPYKCTYCPNAYPQSQDLKTHIRRHTGERFKCNICDAAFIQNHLLSQHKRNVHGMTIPANNGRLKKFISPSIPDQF